MVYRSGGAGMAKGVFGSVSILISKACLSKGVEDPKEARVIEALSGLLLSNNW